MENGEWKMENGEWRIMVENLTVSSINLKKSEGF